MAPLPRTIRKTAILALAFLVALILSWPPSPAISAAGHEDVTGDAANAHPTPTSDLVTTVDREATADSEATVDFEATDDAAVEVDHVPGTDISAASIEAAAGGAQLPDDPVEMDKWENYAAQAWREFRGGSLHEAYKKISIAHEGAPSNERITRMYDMIFVEKERAIKRYVALGDKFFAQKKYSEALEAFSFALEIDPHNPLILAKMNRMSVQAYEYGGDFLKLIGERSTNLSAVPGVAKQDVDIALDLTTASRTSTLKSDLFKARELFNSGKLKEALEAFKKILVADASNQGVARVVKALEERVALSDTLKAAAARYAEKKFGEAVVLFRKAADRFGLSPSQGATFAECLIHLGEISQAEEVLAAHCAEGVPIPAVTFTRALIMAARKDHAAAATVFHGLMKSGFDPERTSEAYYSCFFKASWLKLALSGVFMISGLVFWGLGAVVGRAADDSPWNLLARATVCHERRDSEQAAELLGIAMAVCPQAVDPQFFAVASNNLGILLLEGGKVREAEGRFLIASRAWENFAEARFNLGVCLMTNFETEKEAIDSFRQALALTLRDGLPGGLQRVFPLGRPVVSGHKPGIAVSEMFILSREILKKGKLA